MTTSWAAPPRVVWSVVGGASALALLLAIRDMPVVPFDDAAISFRYAWRIAHGHGVTFNDGDRTNGASAPLYTLLLALFSRLGVDLVVSAKIVGAVCFAASCGLVAWLGARLGGRFAAVAAPLLLMLGTQYRQLALSGMESAFAAVLGLLALALLVGRREVLAGVILGLAVVNKLDAGLLALAIAAAYLLVERRPPWRIALAATVAALPWFAFSTWYFGSPVPYSATQKVTVVQNADYRYDPLWILRDLGADRGLALLVLCVPAVLLVPRLARRDGAAATALAAAVLWIAGHLAFFSLVNLGDSYSWYVTVLYPPVCLVAAVWCAAVVAAARQGWGPRGAVVGAAAASLALVVASRAAQVGETARAVWEGHQVTVSESFEAGRRRAGIRLAELASPGDVVQTCFGWVEYEVLASPIDETCPLSTRQPVGPPRWGADLSGPDLGLETLPPGATLVEVVPIDDEPDGLAMLLFRFDAGADR